MKTRNIILTILAAVLVAVPGTVVAQSGSGYITAALPAETAAASCSS